MAEYFEVPRNCVGLGMRISRKSNSWLRLPRPILRLSSRLETVDKMTSEHYRDAWAWVHFLIHRRYTSRQLLIDQIDTRRRAQPVLPISRIVELQMPKWREEITHHFQTVPNLK